MTCIERWFDFAIPASLYRERERIAASLQESLAILDAAQQAEIDKILSERPELSEQLLRVLLGSRYVQDSVCRSPELLLSLLDDVESYLSAQRIQRIVFAPFHVDGSVEPLSLEPLNPEQLNRHLRNVRRRLMCIIYWRDLNRLSSFTEVCESMTAMAEVCIQCALDFHYRTLVSKHGVPIGRSSGQPQPMQVLGMGKLGGAELNVSSDIDLIFVFPEAGDTDHPKSSIDNQQFFTRLGQRLIKSLNDTSADGFVFRVDMRLRPYGQSGALVSSFSALENYYATQGREWERFAAIKARVVACSALVSIENNIAGNVDKRIAPIIIPIEDSAQKNYAFNHELDNILQAFVYRKYTDFSVIEALRRLKSMIVQEVQRKGMQENVKLGAGGIRELEFIAQVIQLTRGGRDSDLQQRHWLVVMDYLVKSDVLEADNVDKLKQAYIFLRHTEHVIQAFRDEQTQQLPVDEIPQQILAWVMGFDSWDDFICCLNCHRDYVNQQFQRVIAAPQDQQSQEEVNSEELSEWLLLWQGTSHEMQGLLATAGCKDVDAILQQLESLRECWGVKHLSTSARSALDELIPQFLSISLQQDQPDIPLLRLLEWLEKIVSRSSYITFLLENPKVLHRLVVLFHGSVLITELLTQMPSLLDELLDDNGLYTFPTRQELQDELRQRLLRVEEGDLEVRMEVLRYFKLAHLLRVAACELSGALPLMKVSDYLTWVAETILAEVASTAWQEMTAKHGLPSGLDSGGLTSRGLNPSEPDNTELHSTSLNQDNLNLSGLNQSGLSHEASSFYSAEGVCITTPGFIIVAYGKMGGIELSYSSDLDLVFIYNANAMGSTSGPKSIDNQTFYTRLGQKIIHILNARTLSGPLYEVDMRLRPSGNSGLLVSSLSAFERYQNNEAWVWEHQALVRARPVVGDVSLMAEFNQLRQRIIGQSRDLPELKQAVIDMRQKMREHLGSSSNKRANHNSNVLHSKALKLSGLNEIGKDLSENQEKKPLFHLKQDAGGIVDIEFMVQYAVLAWSHQQPSLYQYTDNIRVLEALERDGSIAAEQATSLIAIYQRYRELGHRLALQRQSSLIDEQQFSDYPLADMRKQVQQLWLHLLA